MRPAAAAVPSTDPGPLTGPSPSTGPGQPPLPGNPDTASSEKAPTSANPPSSSDPPSTANPPSTAKLPSAGGASPPQAAAAGDDTGESSSIHPHRELPRAAAPAPVVARPPKSWNPTLAEKNIEIGSYYYNRGSYKAAISRFREALEYKPRDLVATFKLAQALEKNQDYTEARRRYQEYLEIVKDPPQAAEARKALERLKEKTTATDR